MSQKLTVNKFEWIEGTSQLNEDFIKNYNEESDEGCFLEVDVQYPENLHELHNDLRFLPERMKMSKRLLLYMILNHGFNLKKVHRVIKFDQKSWLKPYID